jgi:hypothetical protein
MEVGSADSYGTNPYLNLARSGIRGRRLNESEAARLIQLGYAHRLIS